MITLGSFLVGLVLSALLNGWTTRAGQQLFAGFRDARCVRCGSRWARWEQLPLMTWRFLLAGLHRCQQTIPLRLPMAELATGSLFAVTFWTHPAWPQRLTWAVFWLLLTTVVTTDLESMTVPNALSIPGFLICLALAPASGVQTWGGALAGAGAGFATLLLLHVMSRGRMGLGDAKLYLSIGTMLGPVFTLESLIVASFAGALVGYCMRGAGWLKRREYIPFVPYIAVGVIVIAFYGTALNAWYLNHVLGLYGED